MRIALVSYEFPPETGGGGIGTHLDQLTRAYAQAGHDVTVYAGGATSSDTRNRDGVRVVRIACPDSPSFGATVVEPFVRDHAAGPFDVVEGTDFDASALGIKRRLPSLPYACKLHTPRFVIDELQYRAPSLGQRARIAFGALRRLRRPPTHSASGLRGSASARDELAAISLADVVIAPSAAIASEASRWVPSAASRIAFVPFHYSPPAELLALPMDATTRRVTYLGRLEIRKGVIDLVDAIPFVLKRVPDARFRFVGRAMASPKPGQDMSAFLRARLGRLAPQVEFTGPRPPAELPAIFRETDILVAPSHWESFGLVCCEGMAAGRLVIGSAAGGMAELIEHESSGLLVSPRDPSALADAISRGLNDPKLRRECAANARARVCTMFANSASLVDRNLQCYLDAASRLQSVSPHG